MVLLMYYTSNLTRKWQVTIPLDIRRHFVLQPNQKVAFVKQGDQVVISKARSILDLQGCVPNPIGKILSDHELDELMMKSIADDFDK